MPEYGSEEPAGDDLMSRLKRVRRVLDGNCVRTCPRIQASYCARYECADEAGKMLDAIIEEQPGIGDVMGGK